MESLLPLLIAFALMWFLLVRPQQQRVRAQRALLSALTVGDEVVTAGGIIGTVVALDGDTVTLAVGEGSTLRVVRPAISRRLPPPEPVVDLPEDPS